MSFKVLKNAQKRQREITRKAEEEHCHRVGVGDSSKRERDKDHGVTQKRPYCVISTGLWKDFRK